MSVKIEILDYVYTQSGNIVDNTLGTGTDWTVSNSTFNKFYYNGGAGSAISYFNPLIATSLIIGKKYRISFSIHNYSGTSNVGFSINNDSGVAVGISANARMAGNGSYTEDFVATATGSPQFFAYPDVTCEFRDVSIIDLAVVNWEDSVVGELDVTDHTDFPLALTFQISELQNLTATSGDYSKTFKLPATKNNNKIFKNIYKANIDVNNDVTEDKPCRILINNLYSLKGVIKVTGVSKYGKIPSHYDCVFFGNNLNWATLLDEKYIVDLDWGASGEDLILNHDNVKNSWDNIDCSTSNDLVVYPLISYGEYNETGLDNTVQMLQNTFLNSSGLGVVYGYNDSLNLIGVEPIVDWRPAIYVKDTLTTIFKNIGYTISSEFMETDIFKKLIWITPNFKYNNTDARKRKYELDADWDFTSSVQMIDISGDYTTPVGGWGSALPFSHDGFGMNLGVINTDFTYTDFTNNTDITYNQAVGSHYNYLKYMNSVTSEYSKGGGSYFTSPEYGYYKIQTKGDVTFYLSDVQVDGANQPQRLCCSFITGCGSIVPDMSVYLWRIVIQRKTAGSTSWRTIGGAGTTSGADSKAFISQVQPTPTACINNNFSCIGLLSQPGGVWSEVIDGLDIKTSGVWLNKGDQIRVVPYVVWTPNSWYNTFPDSVDGVYTFKLGATIESLKIEMEVDYPAWGQTYNLQDVIPEDYKQVDFIKGISHAFNLKMTTDESLKQVTIEPFDTFYLPYGSAVDWTQKLDRSKLTGDKWVKSNIKRELIFKYKSDDEDKKVEQRGKTYWEHIHDEYPYFKTLSKKFEVGESEFENPFFAGTYNSQDQTTVLPGFNPANNPYTACLWDENVYSSTTSRPEKGYSFQPRLLYWNRNTGGTAAGYNLLSLAANVQMFKSVTKLIYPSGGLLPGSLSQVYPQGISYDRNDTSVPVLTYGNVAVSDFNYDTGVTSSSVTVKGLFETYYNDMFEMLKSNPRIRTVYISFTDSDIVNLDFRKLVYIDGVYWRINKIIDYKPNKNVATKVELLEWLQLGSFAASAASIIGDTSTGGGSGDPADDDDDFQM